MSGGGARVSQTTYSALPGNAGGYVALSAIQSVETPPWKNGPLSPTTSVLNLDAFGNSGRPAGATAVAELRSRDGVGGGGGVGIELTLKMVECMMITVPPAYRLAHGGMNGGDVTVTAGRNTVDIITSYKNIKMLYGEHTQSSDDALAG